MGPSNIYKGSRVTGAAYLANAPDNLTVLTKSQVGKVLFDGKKAVGIETLDGRDFLPNAT